MCQLTITILSCFLYLYAETKLKTNQYIYTVINKLCTQRYFSSCSDHTIITGTMGGILVPVRYRIRWNLGWNRYRSGTSRFGRYQSYLHHLPLPVPWLDHVHPSSSETVSRATLQFPECIISYPLVPNIYHDPPYPLWRHLLLLFISH